MHHIASHLWRKTDIINQLEPATMFLNSHSSAQATGNTQLQTQLQYTTTNTTIGKGGGGDSSWQTDSKQGDSKVWTTTPYRKIFQIYRYWLPRSLNVTSVMSLDGQGIFKVE